MAGLSKFFDIVFKSAISVVGPAASAASLSIFKGNFEMPWAIGGSIVVGMTAAQVATHAERTTRSSAWFRKIVDARARFEGLWIQTFLVRSGEVSSVKLSVFNVMYNEAEDDYRIQGRAFDAEGKIVAQFYSDKLIVNKTDMTAAYIWEETEVWQDPANVGPKLYGRGTLRSEVFDGKIGFTGEISRASDAKERAFSLSPPDRKSLEDARKAPSVYMAYEIVAQAALAKLNRDPSATPG